MLGLEKHVVSKNSIFKAATVSTSASKRCTSQASGHMLQADSFQSGQHVTFLSFIYLQTGSGYVDLIDVEFAKLLCSTSARVPYLALFLPRWDPRGLGYSQTHHVAEDGPELLRPCCVTHQMPALKAGITTVALKLIFNSQICTVGPLVSKRVWLLNHPPPHLW